MRTRKLGLLAVVISVVVLFSMSQASATVIWGTPSPSLSPTFGTLVNFDDKATGTVVNPTDYASVGVADIRDLGGLTLMRYASSQSQPNYVGTGPATGWATDTMITLTNAASMLGIGIADGRGSTFLTVYDSNKNVIELYNPITSSINFYLVFDETLGSAIKYLEIKSNFVAFDDLQFNTASVPEPSTLLLLGSGLIGFGFFARKRIKG